MDFLESRRNNPRPFYLQICVTLPHGTPPAWEESINHSLSLVLPNNSHQTTLFLNGNDQDQVRMYGGANKAGLYHNGNAIATLTTSNAPPANATIVLHLIKLETNVGGGSENDRAWTICASSPVPPRMTRPSAPSSPV